MSVTINKVVTGDDSLTSVVLNTLNRRDTGAAVVLSPALPQPFSGSGTAYAFTFTDPNGDCPLGYVYTYQLDFSNDSPPSIGGPYTDETPGTIAPGTPAGPLTTAATALMTLIANVPFFQDWTGTNNATAALKHVSIGEVGYPVASISIASGVLTVQTRDVHNIGFGDTITIQGGSLGGQSEASIYGVFTVTGATPNSFTVATALPDLHTVYPQEAFVLGTTRPIAMVGWDTNDLRFNSIGTGGTCTVAGQLQILLEADTPSQFANDPINGPVDAANNYGMFFQGLNELAGTGDFIVLNDTRTVSAPEFTSKLEQDDNTVRFERWRALMELDWGLTG